MKRTCNMCNEQIQNFDGKTSVGTLRIYACTNPPCPNYALVQIPEEQMPKEKVKK